jgi:hypothetical protein
MKEELCYYCGKPILPGDKDKEHIPAKCFYVGYGDEYKTNLITVPAHKTCNNMFSIIDQELRDAIGTLTENQTDRLELVSKSIKSILRGKDGDKRISSENGELFVEFDYNKLERLFIKNFKGVFFHEFGQPIPEDRKIVVTIGEGIGEEEKLHLKGIYELLEGNIKEWKKSGSSEIFKYKIIVMDKHGLASFDNKSKQQVIFSVIIYHEEIICFCIARF